MPEHASIFIPGASGGTTLAHPAAQGKIQPTSLSIGNVFLDVTNFTWELLPGVSAFTLNLNTFPATSQRLERLGRGPHAITISAPSLGVNQKLTIRNVYLRDDRVADEASLSWRVSDRRIFLDYPKFTGHFNLRRKVNDRIGLDAQDEFAYSVEAYRPYSATFSKDKDGNDVRVPWTALGAIRHVLSSVDAGGIDGATFSGVADNGVPIESQSFYEERASVILPRLLQLAEVGFFVTLGGKYKFFDRLRPSQSHRAWNSGGITRGRLRTQRNYRTRPSEIVVWFKQEEERYAEFIEGDGEPAPVYTMEDVRTEFERLARRAGIKVMQVGVGDQNSGDNGDGAAAPQGGGAAPPQGAGIVAQQQIAAAAQFIIALQASVQAMGNDTVIGLENVLQLPRTLEVTVPGLGVVEFTKGEWISIDLALAAWALLDLASAEQPLVKLTKANLRAYWFNNVIGRLYTFNSAFPTWLDPERARRIDALREHYRVTFRIRRPWLDNIHAWSANRVTIVDPVTRTRSSPFVSTQFCEVPNLRPAVGAPAAARVAAVNVDNYSDDFQPSPFIFSEVDTDLGIFQVRPRQDQHDIIRERIRGQVDNIPRYDLNPNGSVLWQNAQLAANFKLRTIITVEWGAPNNKSRLYPLRFDVSDQGGAAGRIEFITQVDTARIDINGVCVNKDMMERIGNFEQRGVMFTHRDVGLGFVHLTGLRGDIEPEGFARGVAFVVDNGFAYTQYDITEPYTGRPPAALMDSTVRKFALRVAEVG